MSNPLAGSLKIMLGRERTAVLDMNAMCLIEEKSGRNALELFDELGRGFAAYSSAQAQRAAGHEVKVPPLPINVRLLRTILWAVLVTDDPALTIEDVGALVNLENFQGLADSLNRLMQAASPVPDGPATGPHEGRNGSQASASSGPTVDTISGSPTRTSGP